MKKLWISILVILCSQIANAATYNIGPGQTYETFTALDAAVDLVGDDIVDGGGNTFNETWTVNGSGTSGHNIILRDAVIDGQNTRQYGINNNNNTYITIDDIEVKNCTTDGLLLRGSTDAEPTRDLYVTVQNCTIHDISNGSTTGDGIDGRGVGLTIYNCHIYNIWYDGIYHNGANATVSYCNIHDVDQTTGTAGGDCIQLACTADAWVHHNTLDHSSKGTKHCFVGTNAASTSGTAMIFEHNTCIGLGIDTYSNRAATFEDGTNGQTVRYNVFRNAYNLITPLGSAEVYGNIFENGLHWGINIQSSSPEGSTLNFYNNTFYNMGRSGSEGCLYVPDKAITVNFKNDTVHTAIYGIYRTGTSATVNADYNNPYNITTATYQGCTGGAHDVTGDPKFYNPDLDDFRVWSDGAGVGVGTDLGATYQRDYYGHWQGDNGAWDIGTIYFNHLPTIQ